MAKKRGNGEGSIYYSESLKRWVGQFSAGIKENGKINRKSVYGKTRKEVSEKIIAKQNEVNKNIFIDKNSKTLKNICEYYIDEQFNSNKVTETTYYRNKETIKILNKLPIYSKEIQKITIQEINRDLSLISDYANSVIDKVYGLILKSFEKAFLLNIITNNPFLIKGAIIKPKSSKKTHEVDSLTIEEQKLLINELNNNNKNYKYHDIFIIALYTGLRIGEILALKYEDIDNNIIHVKRTLTKDKNGNVILGDSTKTYSGIRDIPITPFIKNILQKKSTGLIFTNDNNLINPSTINSQFKRIAKNAGIRVVIHKTRNLNRMINLKLSTVNTHMLRHTYATRCIEAGMSPVVLQRLLGHKDIQTTLNTYTSIFNKFKESEINKYIEYINSF